MFELESDEHGEDDPYFNADEIAFKIRQQVHKDKKVILNKMISSGAISTVHHSSEADFDEQKS